MGKAKEVKSVEHVEFIPVNSQPPNININLGFNGASKLPIPEFS